jgi:hypothetical protein
MSTIEQNRQRLGEVLLEGAYGASHHVTYGIRLRQRLVTAVLAAILAFSELTLSGCGSGGGGAVAASGQEATTGYLKVTSDDYTLKTPTFFYSTVCESFWSIQANIARYVQDIDTRCIVRIDVSKIDGNWPNLNKVFSIEANPQYEKFPGTVLVFNGSESTMNKVEHGIISFTPDSVTTEHVNGTFEVTVTDYGSKSLPLPQYHLKGNFIFKMGEYGTAKT